MSAKSSTIGDKNQAFFDSLASAANRHPWMNDLVDQIQTEVIARRDWIGLPQPRGKNHSAADEQDSTKVRLLDYACGSGELSRTLFPYVDEARGIDISPAMVQAYNEQAQSGDIPEAAMHAVQGDMLASPVNNAQHGSQPFTDEGWFGFDIAVMSMALHHVASPEDAIETLASRLNDGGTIVIIDWLLSSIVFHGSDLHPRFGPGDYGEHSHHHGHTHRHAHNVVAGSEHTITRAGFGKEEMEMMFRDAGCDDIGFVEFREATRLGDGDGAVMQKLFMVKGRKGGNGM